ncbi:TPA: competence protein, partial [Streptococcus pyogenes]|nr:competence protein [Streptococcus pyogenes]
GEPIPDALDTWPSDYKIPYLEGYLKGKEEHSKSNAEVPSGKNPHSQNEPRMPENNIPSPGKDTIPEPPHSEWPQRDPNFGGLSFGQSSDWGRSEDNPNSPSEPRIPGSSIPSPRLPQASENPKEDTSTLTYEKGLEDGRKAKLTNKIDYSRLSDRPDNPFPRDYVRGYFEGIK